MQGRGQYWWMSLLTACIGMRYDRFMHCSISIGAMRLPCEVAYMCVWSYTGKTPVLVAVRRRIVSVIVESMPCQC